MTRQSEAPLDRRADAALQEELLHLLGVLQARRAQLLGQLAHALLLLHVAQVRVRARVSVGFAVGLGFGCGFGFGFG